MNLAACTKCGADMRPSSGFSYRNGWCTSCQLGSASPSAMRYDGGPDSPMGRRKSWPQRLKQALKRPESGV